MIAPAVSTRQIEYEPHGNMLDVWHCRHGEVLVEGPAGTGKTRAILEMLDFIARKYEGVRILICRKTRASMTQSVIKTYDNHVRLPDVGFHTTDQEYRYSNGSVLVLGGMDKASKILSSEYDIIFVNEGTELTEDDHETLTTRLRAGVVPYQQIIHDCNPDADTHWLNARAATPRMKRIVTRHEDNPVYWDTATGDYTEAGRDYIIGKLERLTGVRYLRYRRGVWARAEGLVYDEFDRAVHVIPIAEQAEVTRRFVSRYRAIDFGYTNPFVCQWWATDGDGRLYLYREIYHTQRTVRVHSGDIKRHSKGEYYAVPAICDHDAEDRATLRENHIPTQPAQKAISRGIDLVKDRLKVQGDGRPRLYIFEDAVIEVDESLREDGLPTSTLDEFGSYSWPDSRQGKNEKEQPVDAYNHGMDAMRYMAAHLDGNKGKVWSSKYA